MQPELSVAEGAVSAVVIEETTDAMLEVGLGIVCRVVGTALAELLTVVAEEEETLEEVLWTAATEVEDATTGALEETAVVEGAAGADDTLAGASPPEAEIEVVSSPSSM